MIQGQALAGVGDGDACRRALDRAQGVVELSASANNGGWLRFDGSRLAEERGACLVELGRTADAQLTLMPTLSRSLSERRRGSVHVDLALALANRTILKLSSPTDTPRSPLPNGPDPALWDIGWHTYSAIWALCRTIVVCATLKPRSAPTPCEQPRSTEVEFMTTENGRVFRDAWIAGVNRHFPGIPKPGYVAPWDETPEWEQQCASAVFDQVHALIDEPKPVYVADWAELPGWQRETDADIFEQIEAGTRTTRAELAQ